DDEIALGLLVMQFAADEGEVLNLGVVPEARRTGVGSDLLQDGINLAQALSISRLFLEVASDNAPARALYRRFSFAEVGVRPRYYLRPDGSRVDAVVMSVEL
ncbi:MAG: GNAT family N-acetyltransferase, partial [Pseudomonadota bacterium]